jgi:hypothetical protein
MAEQKAPTKAPVKKAKTTYKVKVIGFYALGKMFRAGAVIKASQYKDYIENWIKEGKIE